MSKKLIWRRILMLLTATFVMLFAGIMYASAIIQTPFMLVENGVFVNASQLGFNYTLTIIFFCLGCLITGSIVKMTSAAIRFALGSMMLFASYFSASYQIITLLHSGRYFLFYMTSGFLGGLGIGIVYTTVLDIINQWFPDRTGFASGVIMAGFGIALLPIGYAVEALGNAEAVGWEKTYIFIGISLAVVFGAAAFVLKPPPPGTKLPETKLPGVKLPAPKNTQKTAPEPVLDDDNHQKDEVINLSAFQMLKRPSFIFIFIYLVILIASGSTAIGFATDIMQDLGALPGLTAFAAGILALGSGAGRLILGWLFDKTGIKQTVFISSATAILAPVTLVMALSSGYVVIGVIGMSLCGFSYGFVPVSCNVFATEFYGSKDTALKFGLLSLVLIPAPFIVMLAGYAVNSFGGLMPVFIGLSALTAIGLFINLAIRSHSRKQ